jgi:hypothetical protein
MGGPGSGRRPSGHIKGKTGVIGNIRLMTNEYGNRKVREQHVKYKEKHTTVSSRTVFRNAKGNKLRNQRTSIRKTYVGRKSGRKS